MHQILKIALFTVLATFTIIFTYPYVAPYISELLVNVTSPAEFEYANVKIGGHMVKAKIADTVSKRDKGLMQVKTLGNLQGMLFIFEKPGFHRIWMKDMQIPLDILWIDDTLKIVHLEQAVTPCSASQNPCPSYTSVDSAKYVLELNSGWTQRSTVKVGDSVEIN